MFCMWLAMFPMSPPHMLLKQLEEKIPREKSYATYCIWWKDIVSISSIVGLFTRKMSLSWCVRHDVQRPPTIFTTWNIITKISHVQQILCYDIGFNKRESSCFFVGYEVNVFNGHLLCGEIVTVRKTLSKHLLTASHYYRFEMSSYEHYVLCHISVGAKSIQLI